MLSSTPTRWAPAPATVWPYSGNSGSNEATACLIAPSRYWLVLTMVFLTELFLDQLNLSPSFTLLKLAFMFWCVAPMEYNGSHVIYEKVEWQKLKRSNCVYTSLPQILAPMFQVSRSWLGDVLQSRLLDEMTETLQDCINHFSEKLPKLTKPPPNTFFGPVRKPRLFKHYLSLNQENITAVLLFLQ